MSGRRIDDRARAFYALDVCTGNLDAARNALLSIGADALAEMVRDEYRAVLRLRNIVAEAYPSEESTHLLAAMSRAYFSAK
jgi:hypothetical protein